MDDTVKEFLIESSEGLDRVERHLLSLEKHPESREILTDIFRAIHSIKGSCGFLGFSKLEEVAHAGEELLSLLRDGRLTATAEIATALLSMVDVIRRMLTNIKAKENEGDVAYGTLIQELNRLREKPAQGAAAAPAAAPATGDQAEATPASAQQDVAESLGMLTEDAIRVDVDVLDRLMNLTGELVLVRNWVMQMATIQQDPTFNATSQRLDLITTKLQEEVMRTRMQPILQLWSKFHRLVRDLSVICNKKVVLDMEGEDTELDRSIIEAIKDPLTHILRNCVDHGIETPEARVKAGKKPEGRVLLRASHEAGHVNISVLDDGGGIHPNKVLQKALDRGLVTADRARRMSEHEIVNLIFLPGFSTAETVTHISGRGVGMDVVKSNIEKVGGIVDVQSVPGKGTTIKLKIPLTLAIIPAVIVGSTGERYSIPESSILELVRLDGEEARTAIEIFEDVPVYRLRGKLLPLVYLPHILYPEKAKTAVPAASSGRVNIVVLQADQRQFGLVVETVHDRVEIVVKSLGKHLKNIPVFAGATIMGDGKVALIMDVLGMAQYAHVITEVRGQGITEKATTGAKAQTTSLLVFSTPDNGRMAVPLTSVDRLEKIPNVTVERMGSIRAVQYRGQILPLVYISEMLPERREQQRQVTEERAATQLLEMFIYSINGRRVGMVVDSILDIMEDALADKMPPTRKYARFTALIQGRITEMLDIEKMIHESCPTFFEETAAIGAQAPKTDA